MAKAIVLFDGDCGLCQRTRAVLLALGSGLLLQWRPLQSGEGAHFGLATETLLESIHIVSGRRIERGFRAAKMILLRTPGFYLLLAAALILVPDAFWYVALPLAIFFAPPFEPAGEAVYRYIAARRNPSCTLPRS